MDDDAGTIQIGEFAKLAGTNLRTLRYYEELGLLAPAKRTEGGFRLYAHKQLDRLAAIKRLQDLGLSLKEIASALATSPGDAGSAVQRLRPALERQIDLTESKIDKMQKELVELHDARKRLLEVCLQCDHEIELPHCDPCPRDKLPLPAVLKALLS